MPCHNAGVPCRRGDVVRSPWCGVAPRVGLWEVLGFLQSANEFSPQAESLAKWREVPRGAGNSVVEFFGFWPPFVG